MKQNKIPRNEYIRKPVGKTNPYKHDVLYTNLGQWKYPGQVTRIPSNDITMQGVPYPVYGEDDLGYSQMMYPGMDYQFPGQYVTETPMAQEGIEINDPYFSKGYWKDPNTRSKNLVQTQVKKPENLIIQAPYVNEIPTHLKKNKQQFKEIPLSNNIEDRDSWLENIAEVFDPTGLSSWDDVYRAYKNTGLSGETALEAFGAIPLLGKIGKSGKIITGGFGLLQDAVKASKYLPASKQQKFIDQAFNMYQKYNKAGGKELDEALGSTTKVLRDKIPYINPNKWSSSDKAINIANKSFKAGRLSDAVQAALGAKDNSGFTWDMRHGEVPKYGGRNIFPQIELGEHGDFAYGGDIKEESEIEEPSTNPKTGETIKSKKEQYQDKIKNNYQSYLESVNNITPYTPTTKEGHMNCIHGVCTVIEGTGAKKFTQEYTGNMTFADARKKEGFYEVDPSKEGFEIGDIIQYARTKSKAATMGRFNTSNSLTPVNKNDLIPQHAKIILNKYIDEDGITRYVVGHNGGEDIFFITPDTDNGDVKEETLLKHYKEGYNTYDGLIVNRYDPDSVDKMEGEKKAELDIIKGKNNYASLYNIPPKITIKREIYDTNLNKRVVEDFGKSRELLDYYKKNYRKLGKTANMPPYLLNQLFHNQVGIAEQESKTGEDLGTKRFVPEVFLPTVRKLKDAVSSSEDWVKDYWSKNANNVKANYKSIEDFKNHLNKNNKLSKEAREYMFYNSPKSKGIFQQKELSKRGRVLGSNFDTPENQFLSSMYLAIDNYHLLKNKYPALSENELIDLTTLMHNAPGKALTKEYVDYYLKNNDIDYVNKVKEQKGVLEQPATKYLEKMQDLNKQKVTTKEVADIKKFLQKLPSNRYGGDPSLPNIEGHYPFGGQNTKTHTHMKEGGWLDKYQTKGEVKPYKPKSIEEYNFRKKMYNDSLSLANMSRKAEWFFPQNPNISKEE